MPEPCPRCNAEVTGDRCPQCGIDIPLYRASLDKLRRGPGAGGSVFSRPAPRSEPPAAPPPAPPPGPEPAAPEPAAEPVPVSPFASPFRLPGAPANPVAAAPVAAAPVSPVAAAPPRPAPPRRAIFHGSATGLFGIYVVNTLFTLLTLGVYYFWAKTRTRRYTYGETDLESDRFAYHGTGRELFVGFLKGAALLFIPLSILKILPELYGFPDDVKHSLTALLSMFVFLFVPVAMVGARRYRLSRTSWRGIRLSFRGRARDFLQVWVVGSILTSLTLGIYYPVFLTQRQAFMVSHAYFGTRKFDFDGRGRDLVWPFLGMVALFPFTLGLSWFWFSARRQRYFIDHTRFGGARFKATMRGGPVAWLTISNFVALILTVGMAWPWTVVRALRFTYRHVTVFGLDVSDVRQDARAASATGEALASFLDADFGVS